MLLHWWFVATVVVWVSILAVWSFLPSAPRWLWAIRQAVLVLLACMVLTLVIVLAVTPRHGDSAPRPTETIPSWFSGPTVTN